MGLKAAIQALQKAEKLKEKVQNSTDLLNDNDAWICQQQLQRIYQQILILDLEYALDRKVEQDLWSHGFKNYIGTLQSLAKDKKNPKRSESQAMLSWCLEAASGFYLTLLQDICTAFDLDLPFRRKGSVFGSGKLWKTIEELNPPHSSSCNYICQHCLVHLGDIARYRSQSRQAEAFYRHAVLPAPSNGHPYNQLALLEASRGDRLSTVFHYVRSVAVRYPFQAAATNLARTLNKSIEEKLNVDGRVKLSVLEYISVFLKLHGLLHLGINLQLSEKCVKLLTTTLTAHIATESLTSWKLVQMLVINFFALHHAGSCLDSDQVTTFTDDQLSSDEKQVKRLITDLMAGSLSAFLLPVYTLKEGEALLEYFALPAIKLTLDWIRLEPKVLSDIAFTSRLQIWPSLCKLLNGLQPALQDFHADKYSYVPLPEDRDLQCFLPLEKALSDLQFSCNDWKSDPPSLNKLRASRLVDFGTWLADQSDFRLISKKPNDLSSTFEAVGGQQVPPSDLIRELEELSLTKLSSPAPSETSSWGSSATGTSTPDMVVHSPPSPPNNPLERRAGILKPQGSLEKSREKEATEEWPDPKGNNVPVIVRRGHKNVAMQAIMKKVNSMADQERNLEAKQVTFKSPSPPAASEPDPVSSWQPQKQPVKQQMMQKPMNHFAYNAPPAIHAHPLANVFNNTEANKSSYKHQYVNHAQMPFHQPPPPNPNQYNVPISQPMQQQYSPWSSSNEGLPIPPSTWCNNPDTRRKPPGMEVNETNHRYQGVAYQRGPQINEESSYSNWNVQHGVGHFPRNGPRKESTMYDQRGNECENLTMFSTPGLGNNTFSVGAGNTYSLFNSPNNWVAPTPCSVQADNSNGLKGNMGVIGVQSNGALAIGQQSLWSGPGPSPLERLLEQQKQLREPPTPKGGT